MASNSLACAPANPNASIEYNGFRFPQGALTESFRVEPVKDASGRTVIYSKFTISVVAHLNLGVGQSVESLAKGAIQLLSQPGGYFRYRGRGLGDFAINLRGERDTVWGPFTKLSLNPHDNQTMRIDWTIEFHAPTCFGARYDGPMEFSYNTTAEISAHGITHRTYKGFIRIAQTRLTQGTRTVFKSADEWREKINPPLLIGFRRIPGTFELSPDKCRLDFNIRDEEFEGSNVPPNDVVEAEAEHSIGSAAPGRLQEWIGSLSATYVIPKGNGLGILSAVNAFGKLANDRLKEFIKLANSPLGIIGGAAGAIVGGAAGVVGPPRVGPFGIINGLLNPAGFLGGLFGGAVLGGSSSAVVASGGATPCIVPISFRMSDPSIYGAQRVRLELQYRIAGANLAQIFALGGLWRKVPDSQDSEAWAISLKDVLGPRGASQLLLFTPGEDQIVDLCASIPPEIKKGSRNKIRTELRSVPRTPPKPFPPAELRTSWLSYNASVRVEEDSGVIVGKTLPTAPIPEPSVIRPWDASLGLTAAISDRTVGITPPTSGSVASSASPSGSSAAGGRQSTAGETYVQRRTSPTTYLVLSGYALRVGYSIPKPALLSAGGQTLVECNRSDVGEGFTQAVVGQAGLDGSVPIIGARWTLRYVLPAGARAGYASPVLPNPVVT